MRKRAVLSRVPGLESASRPGTRPIRGATRRLLARISARRRQVAYSPPSIVRQRGTLGRRSLARWHRSIGGLYLAVQDPWRAQRRFERSISPGRQGVRSLVGLGNSLLAGGPPCVGRLGLVGLRPVPAGDGVAALKVFQIAQEQDPANAAVAVGLARAHLHSGHFDQAAIELDRIAESPLSNRLKASVIDRRARDRGALLRTEATELAELWGRVTAATTDGSTRHKLIRHLVQMGEFPRARQIAVSRPSPPDWSATVLADPLAMVGADARLKDERDWMYVVHAELLNRGEARASHEIKRLIAASVLRERLPAHPAMARIAERVQASAYLYGAAETLSLLQREWPRFTTANEKLVFNKLVADLHFMAGDASGLAHFRRLLSEYYPPASERFVNLVRDRHVLVVGPSRQARPTKEQLRRADVVVTTKRPFEGDVGAPTISYPTDATVRLEYGGSTGALKTEPDHFFVMRQSMVLQRAPAVPADIRLRVMESEDGIPFLGTHFGIQRILYDLIPFGPRSVMLAGTDFYLSDTPYKRGYSNEVDSIYEPNDFQPAHTTAPHDHLWDFEFTKRLVRQGHVDTTPEIGQLLSLSSDEYLERLGRHLLAALSATPRPSDGLAG